MDEFEKRLCDYFTPSELADALDIQTEDLVFALRDIIQEQKDELEEYMLNGE